MVGFTESDGYKDVLIKACKGLGLNYDQDLSLICSGGVIPNSPIGDSPWTIGEFIKLNGGTQNRSKKIFGVYVPIGYGEGEASTSDSVIKF